MTYAEQINDVISNMASSTKTATIMTLMLNSGTSLQYIWSMINNLSLSIHYILIAVKNIPGNAAVF